MKTVAVCVFLGILVLQNGFYCYEQDCSQNGNVTLEPANTQLCDFKRRNPRPVGVLTTTAGRRVELREIVTLNSDLLSNEFFLEHMMHFNHERVPERVVHGKGLGAYGYFEVTHDVSKYTKADVFNGIGKRTPVFGRFSTELQDLGGPDVSRETKGLGIKFYTREGNLDLLCLNIPVYLYRDSLYFSTNVHSRRRNPRTNMFDYTAEWDFFTSRPTSFHSALHTHSEFGIPLSYRHMDAFPVHTYLINNKKGETYFIKFNFRTDQGIRNLTMEEMSEAERQLDFYARDLYNNIERGNYPSWTLEFDIMTLEDIKELDYSPFDVTFYWKKGTYKTVKVGRLVLNRNPVNQFASSQVSVFNVASLVPGIPGPVDAMFKSRRVLYRDAQTYRVGVNHNRVQINRPLYMKTYTRDGLVPVEDNMKDAPVYFPNRFSGPEPIVDETLPTYKLEIIESNAVDFQPMNDFYNLVLKDDHQRQSVSEGFANSMSTATNETQATALRMVSLIDRDLGRRVSAALAKILEDMKNKGKLD